MNIRPRPGKLSAWQREFLPTQARFARAYFLPWGCLCPRLTLPALAQPRKPSHAMCRQPSRRHRRRR